MHSSWKELKRTENEKDWWNEDIENNGIAAWLKRANSYGVNIPEAVAEQWLFHFIDDEEVYEEFKELDLTRLTFNKVSFSSNEVMSIKPGAYGKDDRYKQQRKFLYEVDGDVTESPYHDFQKHITNSWINFGTWNRAPVVLDSTQFNGFKQPYHLIEGYTRLSWAHYFGLHPNNNMGIQLADYHDVWLVGTE